MTPVRALLEELVRDHAAEPGDVTVLYRADTEDQLVLRDRGSSPSPGAAGTDATC